MCNDEVWMKLGTAILNQSESQTDRIGISWCRIRRCSKGIPSDPYRGGAYVMWEDTPYAHIMVPLGPRPGM
jgi:hypothetical protein